MFTEACIIPVRYLEQRCYGSPLLASDHEERPGPHQHDAFRGPCHHPGLLGRERPRRRRNRINPRMSNLEGNLYLAFRSVDQGLLRGRR